MKLLRKLLLPFSVIYWLVTGIRNFLYDKNIFKQAVFEIPVIAIGNLSTGGTGKSPQTEYLIRLLKDKYRLATLSRGYKRKSKGFVLANEKSDAAVLGDEPYQFYSKFPEAIVAVDANRKNGIELLLTLEPKPEVVLLDDAYQHRRVKAGFYVLLTAYGDLYADDFILPTGNLRESRSGADRADIIIVTKCPQDISMEEQNEIVRKLKPLSCCQQVFFTSIKYDDYVFSEEGQLSVNEIKGLPKVLVAGIAKPKPFFDYLASGNDECLTYPDHHDFTNKEIDDMLTKAGDRIIVTTEKDYMRLKGRLPKDKLFYLPIKTSFINRGQEFDKTILNFIENKKGQE